MIFAPLVALTVNALVERILSTFFNKVVVDIGIKRVILKQIKKKLGKKTLEKPVKTLTEDDIETIRNIIREEVQAAMPDQYSEKVLNEVLFETLTQLSQDHEIILEKLDNIESVLENLTLLMARNAINENYIEVENEGLTLEYLNNVFLGSVKNKPQSKKKIREFAKMGILDQKTLSFVERYNFLSELSDFELKNLLNLLHDLKEDPQHILKLETLVHLNILLANHPEHIRELMKFVTNVVIGLTIQTENPEHLIGYINLLDHTKIVDDLPSDSKDQIIANILTILKSKAVKRDDSLRLQLYYALWKLAAVEYIDLDDLESILQRHDKDPYSEQYLKRQLTFSKKIAKFLRKIGIKRPNYQHSLKAIRSISRQLKRKEMVYFSSRTRLQLQRLNKELNMFITALEIGEKGTFELEELHLIVEDLLAFLKSKDFRLMSPRLKVLVLETLNTAMYADALIHMEQDRTKLSHILKLVILPSPPTEQIKERKSRQKIKI